jgi:hypothetical protein
MQKSVDESAGKKPVDGHGFLTLIPLPGFLTSRCGETRPRLRLAATTKKRPFD